MAKRRSEPVKQRAFLAAFAETCTISGAAERARIARPTHYRWLQDASYAERYSAAREEAVERLVAEVRRRGVDGVDRPVMYQGELVFHRGKQVIIREYSDSLLMFLLKKLDPSFRENATIAHTAPGGGPIEVNVRFVAADQR